MVHYSALLVTTAPRHTERCVAMLSAIRDLEVHRTEPASGRILVVQEGETIEQQQQRMGEIRGLPHVARVDLVYHYVDDETRGGELAFAETAQGAMG